MASEKIETLLDEYFALGVAEGREGRTHDTPDGDAQRVRSALSSALAAQDAQAQRTDGWVMVPTDASPEMVRAWEDAYRDAPEGSGVAMAWELAWKAMISARPSPAPSGTSDPRKEALEEAAKLAETIGVHPVNVFAGGPEWYRHAKRIAAAIRALSSEPAVVVERPENIANTKFKIRERVRKIRGSSWQGRICGFYSTDLTAIGYCVESEREPGSVQIYPESALEPVEKGERG